MINLSAMPLSHSRGAVRGEFPQFPQALRQSASELHPEKRQQNAGLSLAEIHLHEETLPSVRSFAVSPKGCTPGGISAISASATPITVFG
jgi:hypothetical protein